MGLAINSDNYVRWSDIVRADTDEAASGFSTVTARIVDASGTEVDGSDINMSAVSGMTNTYEGTLPDLALTDGATYYVEAVATLTGGAKRTKRIEMKATYD